MEQSDPVCWYGACEQSYICRVPPPPRPTPSPPTTGDFHLKKVTPVAEGMSAMVLQAKLHAGIAKGRDSLRHVDGPADNFEALRAGVCVGGICL